MKKTVCAALFAVSLTLSACGPDPVLGTYNFTQTGSDTVESPAQLKGITQQSSSMGTIAVTGGAKSGEYTVTLTPTGGQPCTVMVAKGTGDEIAVKEGQTCNFIIPVSVPMVPITSITAVANARSGKAVVKDNVLTVDIQYDFTASAGIAMATGTGTRTYVGIKNK
jgi:hypothetical protein